MYLWLSSETLNGALTFSNHLCAVDPTTPPETQADVLRARRNGVLQIMQKTHPELVGDESFRVYTALSNLVQCLPPGHGDLDFAIHLGLAHACLPPAQRKAREQVVDATIERYFGSPNAWRADVSQRLKVLRTQILLLPDALMESWLGSHCGLLLIDTILDPSTATCEPQARRHYQSFDAVVARLALAEQDKLSILQSLFMMYCILPPAQRPSLVDRVLDARCARSLPVLVRANAVLSNKAPFTPLHKVGALLGILSQCVEDGVAPSDPRVDELIDERALRIQLQGQVLYGRACNATIEALRAGVPMGVRGATSRAALLAHRLAMRRLTLRLAPGRPMEARAPAKGVEPSQGPSDLAPVHAWSVARLVRWIEGPLAERSTTGRLNRQNVVALDKKGIEQDTREQRDAGLPLNQVLTALTEDEVGAVINDGLSATARFFGDDIQELAPLATSLGAATDLLGRCLELQEPLRALSDKPAAFDEERARALLQDAEDRIGELRNSIKASEASAQLFVRFSSRLAVALKAETLVLGKRHGGVIACALRNTDWAWVAQRYHRRWLPQVTQIVIDGELVTLASDQAVALYVTGSSQSGHAFDVSVHLWQRRAGGTDVPSDLMDDCPPMNEAQWFDTYIPCAVLHVPQAQ